VMALFTTRFTACSFVWKMEESIIDFVRPKLRERSVGHKMFTLTPTPPFSHERTGREPRSIDSDKSFCIKKKSYLSGRGHPLSFILSCCEISWFDEQGESQRCDWPEKPYNLMIHIRHIQNANSPANHSAIFPLDLQNAEFRQMAVWLTVDHPSQL
jgi:hypothetical protein